MFIKALDEAVLKKEARQGMNFNRDDNLEDDDAIIRLKKALDGNPPNLVTRMKKHDIDNSRKLNMSEFTSCMEELNLSP